MDKTHINSTSERAGSDNCGDDYVFINNKQSETIVFSYKPNIG